MEQHGTWSLGRDLDSTSLTRSRDFSTCSLREIWVFVPGNVPVTKSEVIQLFSNFYIVIINVTTEKEHNLNQFPPELFVRLLLNK